jgi:hypothetical protein
MLSGNWIPPANITYTAQGWHGHFYCQVTDAAGAVTIEGHAPYCVTASCDWIAFTRNFLSAKMSVDPAASGASAWAAAFSENAPGCAGLGGDAYVMCRASFTAMCADFPNPTKPQICSDPAPGPTNPPPAVWTVKGPGATRVVYSYIAATNKRGVVTNLTVPVGSPCDPSIKVVETLGTLVTTYMGVPGGIAVCEAK